MRTVRQTKQVGFTLIELVAALSIFALLSVMAYGGLNSIIRVRQGVGAAQERMTQWQKGVYRIRADLESTVNRPVRDDFGDFQPALYLNPRGGLEWTRAGRRNPLQQPRSGLERVEYILQDDALFRRVWANTERTQGDEGLAYPVLEGIREWAVRFLGPQGNAGNNDAWQPQWPPLNIQDPLQAGIPRAVELVLITEHYGEVRLLFGLSGA